MTKQKEIREGMAGIIRSGVCQDFAGVDIGTTPQDIMEYLHSQGCVLKVDRELPLIDTWYDKIDDKDWTRELIYQDGQIKGRNDKAGYVAVEPLIEEDML